jgi:CHAT domain-containing protein
VEELLAALGEMLIPKSFRETLARYAAGQLVIVPDRELNYVPFACLRLDSRYLIEQYDLLYWPSVTAFLLCEVQDELRRMGLEQPLPSIVLGDPVFANPYRVGDDQSATTYQLDPLPGTAREARLVANLLGVEPYARSAASLEGMMAAYHGPKDEKRVRRYLPVLHLATHGLVQMDNPLNSFIALADGPLTARFLYEYDPGIRCQLVVLSACQTGIGALHPDSIIGLTNAFLICGACSVAATLWQIPDNATQRLMVDFYQELKAGATLSAALAKAQRTMLQNPNWQSPFFWGAFKMTGSDRNPFQVISPQQRKPDHD